MSRNFSLSYTSLALAAMLMIAPITAMDKEGSNETSWTGPAMIIVGTACIAGGIVAYILRKIKTERNRNNTKMLDAMNKIKQEHGKWVKKADGRKEREIKTENNMNEFINE